MNTLLVALAQVRRKAAELRECFGDDARARAIEWAAGQIEAALREQDDERLTLREASARSGYSADHVGRLLRNGKLRNVGHLGSPRVRAGDLPHRLPHVVESSPSGYDPIADARMLSSRQGGR